MKKSMAPKTDYRQKMGEMKKSMTLKTDKISEELKSIFSQLKNIDDNNPGTKGSLVQLLEDEAKLEGFLKVLEKEQIPWYRKPFFMIFVIVVLFASLLLFYLFTRAKSLEVEMDLKTDFIELFFEEPQPIEFVFENINFSIDNMTLYKPQGGLNHDGKTQPFFNIDKEMREFFDLKKHLVLSLGHREGDLVTSLCIKRKKLDDSVIIDIKTVQDSPIVTFRSNGTYSCIQAGGELDVVSGTTNILGNNIRITCIENSEASIFSEKSFSFIEKINFLSKSTDQDNLESGILEGSINRLKVSEDKIKLGFRENVDFFITDSGQKGRSNAVIEKLTIKEGGINLFLKAKLSKLEISSFKSTMDLMPLRIHELQGDERFVLMTFTLSSILSLCASIIKIVKSGRK